jgi:hypothetical protein
VVTDADPAAQLVGTWAWTQTAAELAPAYRSYRQTYTVRADLTVERAIEAVHNDRIAMLLDCQYHQRAPGLRWRVERAADGALTLVMSGEGVTITTSQTDCRDPAANMMPRMLTDTLAVQRYSLRFEGDRMILRQDLAAPETYVRTAR